jgi:hypothetical protein
VQKAHCEAILNGFLHCNCEGTEQLRYNSIVAHALKNTRGKYQNKRKRKKLKFDIGIK